MKTGMVTMAQVGRYGRMDAGFHLAVNDIAGDLPGLEARLTVDQALALVDAQETAALKCLEPLVRGTGKNRRALLGAAKEYPFIACALLAKNGVTV
jgi:hypothetical protein